MNEPHEAMPHSPSNRVSLYTGFGGGGGQRLVAVQSLSKRRAN
jgi:hypothetical protein